MRIIEVISNLITNAINATRNTSTGKISIYAKVVENSKNDTKFVDGNDAKSYVVVSIEDNGIGIDPEIEPQLFTKFATRSESGLGLGLYISRSIVHAHKGKIRENNNQNRTGATFSFSLPIYPDTTQTSTTAYDDPQSIHHDSHYS